MFSHFSAFFLLLNLQYFVVSLMLKFTEHRMTLKDDIAIFKQA